MIVTWIAIQSQPFPWEERCTDIAYVACGENAGELALIRSKATPSEPGIERLLGSIEKTIATEKAHPNLGWLRKAIPDQGTSIRLSRPQSRQAESYEEELQRLSETANKLPDGENSSGT